MGISTTMNLNDLAERMGSSASLDDAETMRALLVTAHDGKDTCDVDQGEWLEMLARAGADA